MSEYLALTWSEHRLTGIEGHATDQGVFVERHFDVQWPDDVDPLKQPASAGRWLRTELHALGINSQRAIVCLPRENVVVRRLDVPNAADDVLPGLVRYQAATQLSLPLDQSIFDYVPLPSQPNQDGCQVLLFTVARETYDNLATAIAESGLELSAVETTPLATLEVISHIDQRRDDATGDMSLIVTRRDDQVEVSVMNRNHLVLSHLIQLNDDDPSKKNRMLLGEINRALVAGEPFSGTTNISRAWLIGQLDAGELRRQLRDRLGCDVHYLDSLNDLIIEHVPNGIRGDMAKWIGPLGMLLATKDALVREKINFACPRQNVVRRGSRRLMIGIAAGVVLLAIVASWVGSRLYLSRLENELVERQRQDQELDLQIRQGQPLQRATTVIRGWLKRNDANWLEHMESVTTAMPDVDRIRLKSWRFDAATPQRPARLHAEGVARQRTDVELLNQKLAERPGYRIRPNEIQADHAFHDYPIQFQIDADLIEPEAEADR